MTGCNLLSNQEETHGWHPYSTFLPSERHVHRMSTSKFFEMKKRAMTLR
jgi:hypothetical protein